MAQLFLHGKKLDSIFELLGDKENDITFSVGWALSRCKPFLNAMIADLFPGTPGRAVESILLQDHSKHGGFTDIEIRGENLYCIIEAKRGWSLPSEGQLKRYGTRIEKRTKLKVLLVISECSPEYARHHLPDVIHGIPVRYKSWKQVVNFASDRSSATTHAEKRLLGKV